MGMVPVWTRQHLQVLNILESGKVYRVEEEHIRAKNDTISDYYLELYRWYTRHGSQLVPAPPGVEFPIWVSLSAQSMLQPVEGTVVLATVKGDVHDLGKNIVGALLENSGFNLIDLGKDVPAEDIVAAAKENKAAIVGLCALMTTTMTEIDEVIRQLKKENIPAKVMVGGAALTQEYAQEAGADFYASDGVKALNIANKIVGEN